MDVKELRIGNKVFADFEDINHSLTIAEILDNKVYGFDYSDGDLTTYDGYGFHRLLPIPLKEEILLKAGFERFAMNLLYNGLLIKPDMSGRYFYFYGDMKFVEIKFVHSLQNLYFALTGEELNIEL